MPPELLTMTDLSFLPQTLVLLRTLEEVAPDVRLRVLAVDAAAADLLRARTSGRVDVVEPRDLMARDAALAAARGGRSHREWCWTLAPAFCSARIEAAPPGHTIAWVDSDIAFYRSPAELEDALGEASALLVPHRYHRQYRNSAPPEWLDANYGSLNGGTVVLRNDATGRRGARGWRDRTLQGCRAEGEAGRYRKQRHP